MILAVVSGVTQATAGAQHGSLRVSGVYEVHDFGTITCVPVGASTDLLRCTTTGLKSHYSGDLEGESSVDFVWVINCRTGRSAGNGVEAFAGSINGGGQGALTWRLAFASAFDCTTFVPSGFRGIGLIRSSSGALAGLGGLLKFGDVTYDGVLR